MELVFMTYMVAILLLSACLFLGRWKRNNKKAYKLGQLPQGTLGWPFLGETMEYISCAYTPFPESFMDKRNIKYGDVFKSHLFGSSTIVSINPEVSKFVLQSDSTVFMPSYPGSLKELMGKASILQISGSLHKKVHGLVGSLLKSPQFKSKITSDMEKCVLDSMKSWEDDQVIHIQDVAKQIAFRIIIKGLMGVEAEDEIQYMKQEFQQFLAGLISLPIKIPGLGLHRSLQSKKRLERVVMGIIKERRKGNYNKSPCNNPSDVIEAMMNEKSVELSDDHISDNVIDLMIPGEESVPTLITLVVKYLSGCPRALQQMEEENMELKLRKAKSGETLSWSDYMSLSFTQSVLSEALRMGNIVNGVYRKAMQDVVIKGHLIPKGWCVLTYFRSIHLDDRLYNDPHTFNPWTWQESANLNSSHFSAFGGGLRLCPGIDLARLEASIFLHQLITNFKWVAEEDTIVSFPTVKLKNGMPIKIKRKPNTQ